MWYPLRAFGFIYYEVYVTRGGWPVAWISRENFQARYVAFYCDGHNTVAGTRGSMANARALMAEAVAKYKPA